MAYKDLSFLSIYKDTNSIYGYPKVRNDRSIQKKEWELSSDDEENASMLSSLVIDPPVEFLKEEYVSILRVYQFYINSIISNGGSIKNNNYFYNKYAEIKILDSDNVEYYNTYIAKRDNSIDITDFELKNTDFDKDNWSSSVQATTNTIKLQHQQNMKFKPEYIYDNFNIKFSVNQNYTPQTQAGTRELPETSWYTINVSSALKMENKTKTYSNRICFDWGLNMLGVLKPYITVINEGIINDLYTAPYNKQCAYDVFNSYELFTIIRQNPQNNDTGVKLLSLLLVETYYSIYNEYLNGVIVYINNRQYKARESFPGAGANTIWGFQSEGYGQRQIWRLQDDVVDAVLSMSQDITTYQEKEPDFVLSQNDYENRPYLFRPYLKFNNWRDATIQFKTSYKNYSMFEINLKSLTRTTDHYINGNIHIDHCWKATFEGQQLILPYWCQRILNALPASLSQYWEVSTTVAPSSLSLDGFVYPLKRADGTDIKAGDIQADKLLQCYYKNNRFLLFDNGKLVLKRYTGAVTVVSGTNSWEINITVGSGEKVISATPATEGTVAIAYISKNGIRQSGNVVSCNGWYMIPGNYQVGITIITIKGNGIDIAGI